MKGGKSEIIDQWPVICSLCWKSCTLSSFFFSFSRKEKERRWKSTRSSAKKNRSDCLLSLHMCNWISYISKMPTASRAIIYTIARPRTAQFRTSGDGRDIMDIILEIGSKCATNSWYFNWTIGSKNLYTYI